MSRCRKCHVISSNLNWNEQSTPCCQEKTPPDILIKLEEGIGMRKICWLETSFSSSFCRNNYCLVQKEQSRMSPSNRNTDRENLSDTWGQTVPRDPTHRNVEHSYQILILSKNITYGNWFCQFKEKQSSTHSYLLCKRNHRSYNNFTSTKRRLWEKVSRPMQHATCDEGNGTLQSRRKGIAYELEAK